MEESHAFTASHRVTPLIAGSRLYADNLTKEERMEGERGKERETRGMIWKQGMRHSRTEGVRIAGHVEKGGRGSLAPCRVSNIAVLSRVRDNKYSTYFVLSTPKLTTRNHL
uniref:Uncharacterized protein n=1 Tax=Oryza nivara TaxID=4536 RepID=A0A0E0HR05_ORYNI